MSGIYEVVTIVKERRHYRIEAKSLDDAIDLALSGDYEPLRTDDLEPEAMQSWKDVTDECDPRLP